MDEITDYAIAQAMVQYGGGFVSRLGALWQSGDTTNQATLKAAFPTYWAEYAELMGLAGVKEHGDPDAPERDDAYERAAARDRLTDFNGTGKDWT